MISASGVSGEESGRGLPYQALKEWQMPLRLQIGWYRGVFRPRGFLGLENFFVFMVLLQKTMRNEKLEIRNCSYI